MKLPVEHQMGLFGLFSLKSCLQFAAGTGE